MVSRRKMRTLKCGIILITLLTAYLLVNALYRFSCKRQTLYEVEPIAEVPLTCPFVKDEPKLVILLSYQRSGSSFVGEWFNTNPDVFYNFEPVDSLYSAMYGTPQNSNVPSDITNYPNGSARILPVEELSAVSNYLHQFLSCDLDGLPVQSLLSYYFIYTYNHTTSMSYTMCIRKAFFNTFRRCEQNIGSVCGSRFGKVREETQEKCFKRLWLKQQDPTNSAATEKKFNYHQRCVDWLKKGVRSKCQHLLQDSCQNRSIRVMKTVRATMNSMEPLLATLPNFRVIHLVRDPRSVALSRRNFSGNVLGIFSGRDAQTIGKEAKLICSTVVRDIKVRLELEKKYPGRIYALNYDEIITNTTLYLDNVYRFLDATSNEQTVAFLSTNVVSNRLKKSSKAITSQWQDALTYRAHKEIVESCKEFYDLVKFNWAM